jgi:acetyl-CoA C-acetyltransferase
VPVTVTKLLKDKSGAVTGEEEVTLARYQGNRPRPRWRPGIAAYRPRRRVRHSGQRQPALGWRKRLPGNERQRGGAAGRAAPLDIFRGFAVAACEPDEMGISPVFAMPKLLKQTGLTDIGMWKLNHAFAVQVVYCRDQLGIDPAPARCGRRRLAIGHPFGMSGSRMTGHALIEASAAARNMPW